MSIDDVEVECKIDGGKLSRCSLYVNTRVSDDGSKRRIQTLQNQMLSWTHHEQLNMVIPQGDGASRSDAQNASHIKLSSPHPATSHSKALAKAVWARLGDEASARSRTVGLARHAGLPCTESLRTSWHRVQRILIRTLHFYVRALPCGHRGNHEKLYHEVDALDDVDFAMIRPLWPFAPKCWPNLCHNSIINLFFGRTQLYAS